VELSEQLSWIAEAARGFAEPGEELAAVIPAEPATGVRVYLCAYGDEGEDKSWLALDEEGRPIESRSLLRDAVSIAALCEVAEEVAGGGRLEELRSELARLRLTENPPGIEEAEEAALALERAIGVSPRVASPFYLDDVGAATRRLEQALGEIGRSPFAEALKQAVVTVDELSKDVESSYKAALA
jgi:hypothetical protein